MTSRFAAWLVLLGLLLAAPLAAQDIPAPLRDWQGWVLHEVPEHACPFLANRKPGNGNWRCAWPGRLALDAGREAGRFTLDVHLDAPGWVSLPGDARAWPQAVSANRQPVVVLEHAGVPAVHLEAGDYQLQGSLPWASRPARLALPEAIGLVTLRLDGQPVARIEREGGALTLGEAAAAERQADALALRVYRRLDDGVPPLLISRIELGDTGSTREVLLGPTLPAGFVATALDGELPARLEGDGRLRVQLRPGQWTLTLAARATGMPGALALAATAEPWPAQEIWSYADAVALRSSRAEGQGVDPAQAGVPDEWQELPAFALDAQHGLKLVPGLRGVEGGASDQVRLERELWLDFDGRGWTAHDTLSGELHGRQRLDVAAPWQLQHALVDGDPALVTHGGKGLAGVELRDAALDLEAGLRLVRDGAALPVAGWQLPLESVEARLHLPDGYRLVAAPGADQAADTWLARWDLFDLFLLALGAMLALRLLGWRWGVVAAVWLALGYHEPGGPLWTLLLVFVLALLARALGDGRLHRLAQVAARLLLVLALLWSLPFVAREARCALHPQLENAGIENVVADRFIAEAVMPAGAKKLQMRAAEMSASPPPPAPPAPSAVASAPSTAQALESVTVTGTRLPGSAPARDVDSRNVIQVGAGMPDWDRGNDYHLAWSGPVTVGQGVRLVIAPDWLVRLLRLLLAAALLGLLARLAMLLWPGLPPRLVPRRGGAAAALLVLGVWLAPAPAGAQDLPDEALRQALRERLTEAPACVPACASLAEARLDARGDTIDLALVVHAGAKLAFALPQGDRALTLQTVALDGRPALLAGDRGQLLVRLERGVHRLDLRYLAGAADSANLRFPVPAHQVRFAGTGWTLAGVDGARMLGDSLALERVREAADGALPTRASQEFPPWVRLTRRLVLGVDWRVENVVERVAPERAGFSVSLPLLPGEHPLGADAPVKDGRITLAFAAGQDTLDWTSRLDVSTQLALAAPALEERAETWVVSAAPQWHVAASGVPLAEGDGELLFQPLPGETLALAIERPAAVPGAGFALDGVSVRSRQGERAMETTLTLRARGTHGGEHAITLPERAELLEVSRDGETLKLAVGEGRLALPLQAGEHVYQVRLRVPETSAWRTRLPAFAFAAPVANIDQSLAPGQDRWVLWTWGPAAGPAVLYWSQLALLLLAAWLLARFAPTPLAWRHWLLLGLGFSAFAWGAFALVAAWLLALGWRARAVAGSGPAWRFNLIQIGLAVLSVAALAALVAAVPEGLLGRPDMSVAGNGSSATDLRWFSDRSAGGLPGAGVVSVSLWWYKLAMLAWALWLAFALVGWLRWAFAAWSHGGFWRRWRKPPPAVESPDA